MKCYNFMKCSILKIFLKFIKYREATWNVIEWEKNTEQV